MSWALHVLELDEAADERAIKRAYANRLRVTRPDEDPIAFQHLHEAYQAALDWVRQEALANTADEDEPAEHATDIAPWPPDADVAWAPPETRSYSPPWPPRGTPVLLRTAQVAELEGAVHVSGHAHTILRMAYLSSLKTSAPGWRPRRCCGRCATSHWWATRCWMNWHAVTTASAQPTWVCWHAALAGMMYTMAWIRTGWHRSSRAVIDAGPPRPECGRAVGTA